MKDKITRLQEANVQGAMNLTQVAKLKSDDAKQRVDAVKMEGGPLALSETTRKKTESFMNR